MFYLIGLFGLYRYCRKIKKDPQSSILKEEYLERAMQEEEELGEQMTVARILGLAAFGVVIVVQGVGCTRLGLVFSADCSSISDPERGYW